MKAIWKSMSRFMQMATERPFSKPMESSQRPNWLDLRSNSAFVIVSGVKLEMGTSVERSAYQRTAMPSGFSFARNVT